MCTWRWGWVTQFPCYCYKNNSYRRPSRVNKLVWNFVFEQFETSYLRRRGANTYIKTDLIVLKCQGGCVKTTSRSADMPIFLKCSDNAPCRSRDPVFLCVSVQHALIINQGKHWNVIYLRQIKIEIDGRTMWSISYITWQQKNSCNIYTRVDKNSKSFIGVNEYQYRNWVERHNHAGLSLICLWSK
jgi:hypothetical protein